MRYLQGDFILDTVLSHPTISNTDKMVLIYWLIQAPSFHPSSYRIAEQMGKSRRTVRNSFNKLVEVGILEEIGSTPHGKTRKFKMTKAAEQMVVDHVHRKYGRSVSFWLRPNIKEYRRVQHKRPQKSNRNPDTENG